MNKGFVIFGTSLLIAFIIIKIIFIVNDNLESNKKVKKLNLALIILGISFNILGQSFCFVPTGYTGVRTTFGQISESTVNNGFNLKAPFIQNIKLVNNKQQDKTISEQIWGETKEKTPVYASDTVITYRVSSDKSAWIFANISDHDKNLIDDNIVSSAIKSAMIQFDAESVTNRSKIEPVVKSALNEYLAEKYGEDTVTVSKVVINNMDFEESYNKAISQRSIAQQKYEKQLLENKTKISKAEADKQVTITNAKAKAEATLINAKAQSDANALLNKSLSEKVIKSKFYDKWDGKLPTVMGENSIITDVSGK